MCDMRIFYIFAPLFRRKADSVFIKKAHFRFSVSVNLDIHVSMHGCRKWSWPIYVGNCQIGGAPFSYLCIQGVQALH